MPGPAHLLNPIPSSTTRHAVDRLALLLASQQALLRTVYGAALHNITVACNAAPGSTESLTAIHRLASQLSLLTHTASALADGPAALPAEVQLAASSCRPLLQQLPPWLVELSGLCSDALVLETVPPIGRPPDPGLITALEASLQALQSAAAAVEVPLPDHQSPAEQQLAMDAALSKLRCCNPACTNFAGSSEGQLPSKLCSGCRTVRFCCEACSRAHWPQHRRACKLVAARAHAG